MHTKVCNSLDEYEAAKHVSYGHEPKHQSAPNDVMHFPIQYIVNVKTFSCIIDYKLTKCVVSA